MKFNQVEDKISGWILKTFEQDKYQNYVNSKNLTSLKVLDNREYLKDLSIAKESLNHWRFIIAFLAAWGTSFINVYNLWLILGMFFALSCSYAVVIISILRFLYYKLHKWFKVSPAIYIIIQTVVLAGIFTWVFGQSTFPLFFKEENWLNHLLTEYNLQSSSHYTVEGFWSLFGIFLLVLLVALWLSLKSSSIFELEKMGVGKGALTVGLTIIALFIKVSLEDIRPMGIVVVLLTGQAVFISWYIKSKIAKLHEQAQEIFEWQLLIDKPVYQKLKKCYAFGGQKYKDKMLNNKEMRQVILQNEKDSFYKLLNNEV